MIKLLKYLKPYLLWIFLAIGLLFAQANVELALPDYLSDIVDTGIQQGGVENAVPVAIRESEFNRVSIFMSPENRTYILDEYTLVDENSSDYSSYLEDYPILENESIYVLNKVKKSTLNQMDELLTKPIVTVFILEEAYLHPENASYLFILLGIDPANFSSMDEFFFYFSLLPNEYALAIADGVAANFEALGETMLSQFAVIAVRAEYGILGMNLDKLQSRYILKAGGLMLLMTFLSVLCTIAVSYLASRTAAGMARNIRYDLFDKVEHFSGVEFDTFSTASLITRSTNDVTQIQMVTIMIIRLVFYAPILGIGGVIRALNKNTSMWWLIGIAVLVLIVLVLIVFFVALPKFNKIQSLTDRINLVARENLTGLLVVRAFNMEKFEENRFDKANIDLTAVSLFINRLMVIMMPVMMLIMNGLMLAILWVGSHQVADAVMQVGDMMAFMQYSLLIVMAFLMLTMMFILLPRAVVSGRRINEVLITEPTIKDPEQPQNFDDPFTGVIEFRDVSFKYPGAKKCALENITFIAKPGQTTGIIGATGSGKSTLINLIPRFYDVNKGSILVNGIDIRNVTQHNLRDKIGYVPQKSSLFSGTIKSNMLFADENAEDSTIQKALDMAQATEFVSTKPNGIDSEIAQGGTNVSGGQKQRLSIARAIVKQPPIYIFDDCVSALDFKTDAALRKALREETGDSTVFMVSQRVSTLKNADQIIVLEEGQIIGLGTHDELMETCDVYREIAISQLELEGAL
ncbi:MAG: ABC transporter ATP-binding protein [Asgard group archaeon]|nr:ABC transporter ATP-binding protein [Asgard group archaeon]